MRNREDIAAQAAPPDGQVRVQRATFDPGAELSAFSRGRVQAGAVASFTGLVRAADGDGASVLELEHYPGFTEREITRILAGAMARFRLIDARVIHRFGAMAVGEPIVFVACASAHRAEAFAATQYLMDYLKTDAPFWKRESSAAGTRWIEPTPADRVRRLSHDTESTTA